MGLSHRIGKQRSRQGKRPSVDALGLLSRFAKRSLALQMACAGVLATGTAGATTLTWDANAGVAGQTDGAGTWLSTDQWWDGSANATWNNGTPDVAIIGSGGVGGTITLGAVTAGSLTFDSYTGTYVLSGGTLTLNNGLTANSGAGAVSITSAMVVGSGQTWVNNSPNDVSLTGAIAYGGTVTLGGGTFRLTNQSNTGTGGLVLNSGKLIVGTGATANFIAGTVAGGVLTLSGGIVTSSATGSGGNRIFGNDLVINGTVQIGDGLTSGNTYVFQGANQTFNGATISARDNNGVTFQTGSAVLAGDVTVNAPGVGTAAAVSFNGGLTVSGAANANRTMTLSNAGGAVNFAGAIAGTASGQTITLAGTGTNNNINLITSGANTPTLIVNGDPAGVFKFSGASTFNGGVVLTNGIAEVTLDTVGAVTSGPMGTGLITMNGGTIRPGSAADRSLTNGMLITTGSSTFASSTASGRALSMTGNTTIAGTPTINFNNTNVTVFNTGTFTLASDATFAGTGNYSIRNGMTWTSPRTLTLANTGTASNLRGALNGGSNALTLAGSSTNFSVGDGTNPAVTGTSGGIVVDGPSVSFAATGNTFTGGVTVRSGRVRIGADSTVAANIVTQGGLGVGAFTLAGGAVSGNSNTARVINNNFIINGDGAFGVLGDAVNTGALTFNPTGVTGGSITLNGARTLGVYVSTTLTGPITGSGSPSLTVKGASTLTLNNGTGTASTFGNLTVGDNAASGSQGGTVTANSQNALGTGAVTVNYGGTVQTVTTAFNPSNTFTINNGGTLNLIGATTPSSLITYNSGARIATATGNTNLTAGTTAVFPNGGVLLFATGNTVAVTGAYTPSGLAADLSLGGTLGANTTFGTTTLSNTAGVARTLAFNATGAAVTFTGWTVNADLTVAGGGSSSLGGLGISQASGGSLGTLTEDATPRSLTVAMGATGNVSVNRTATGWTGGTTVNSGILAIDGATATQKMAGANGIVLNGGTIRNQNNANNNTNWQDAISVASSGGVIESFSTSGSNYQDVTFSGTITGSGPLTLRYGGNTGGSSATSSVILAPGAASSYSGTITLATSSGTGRVQFNSNSLAGLANGGVVVTAGTAFGVDALATLTGNIAKFNTNADSILALDNINTSSIDLSATGINRNIRIGNRNDLTYSGTLTPFGTSYNFTPSGGRTLTLATANQLTGGNSLNVQAGAVSPGAYGVATGTLAVNASQNYTGGTTISGVARNSMLGGGQTGATVQMGTGGAIVGSTSITVERGSVLALGGTNGQISSTDPSINVIGGSTLRIGDIVTPANNNGVTNRINDGATINLGGTSGGGATLQMAYGSAGAVSESVKSLTLNPGDNTIGVTNAAAGTLALTFTDAAATVYNRNAGSVVNISNAAGFTVNFSNVPTANVSGTGGAAILVGAFLNNAGFASATGTVGAPTYTVQNAAGSWAAGQNIDTSAGITGTTAGAASINSLRAVNGGTLTIGTSASDSLTIDSGMIIAGANGPLINGPGSLASGNGKDFIINMSGGNFTVAARILGGVPLTVTNGSSVGNLLLSSSGNGFTGINVYGNRVIMQNAGAWGNSGPINIATASGILGYAASTNKVLDSGYTINVGSIGGSFIQGGTGTLTVQGAVTLNGTMTVGSTNGTIVNDGTLDFQGNISGAGAVAVGWGNRARVLFSGNNSAWTGGLIASGVAGNGTGTTNIFGFNANSFGSGPMVVNRAANLYFDTNAAGPTTLNQAVAYNSSAVLSFWGLGSGLSTSGGTAPLTFNGQIIGTGGLTFQGTATADNQVSEVVLKNVSTSGTPTPFSFGTSTSGQNFVNGQGGIQLGVTGFKGVASNSATDRVEDGSGANSAVLDGALGFVRFDGAPSFLPGAVGPGYISAIRRAGSGKNGQFGYLVTGGSTYALPEGKSFVIGSLGTGAQQYGTLGAAGGGVAVLTGSPKMAGFAAGDVNIHANAAADAQSLNLLARSATDTLQIGTVGTGVVFAPTYGDSGVTSAITLMSTRTGATTINKIGAGTVDIVNAHFNNVGGAADSAKAGVTLNVNAGTLRYTQADTGTSYAAVNVNNGGTLSGGGSINGNVSVVFGGTLAPGNSPGILSTGSLAMASGSTYAVDLTGSGSLAGTNYDQTAVTGTVSLGNATLILIPASLTLSDDQFFTIIANDGTGDAVTGTFNGFAEGAIVGNYSGMDLYITYTGEGNALSSPGSGNDVGLYTSAVPEPTSLGLLGAAGLGLLARRRRRDRV